MKRYVVIGGGIAGLSAALELAWTVGGRHVTLVEASGRLGGPVSTERRDGYIIERGPDGVLSRKQSTWDLIRALGIEHRIIERNGAHPGAWLRTPDGLRAFPSGLTGMVPLDIDSLRESGILSEQGLARLAEEPSIPARTNSGERDESVRSFFSRRFGDELFERLVAPLVSGIYAGSGNVLSMRALFPNLLDIERQSGSVMEGLRAQREAGGRSSRTAGDASESGRAGKANAGEAGGREPGGREQLGAAATGRSPAAGFISLAGGMGELVEEAARALRDSGAEILTGVRCRAIAAARVGCRVVVEPAGGLRAGDPESGRGGRGAGDPAGGTVSGRREIRARAVVTAIPARELAGIMVDSKADAATCELTDELRGIEARSSALVTFAFSKGSLERFPRGAGYVVSHRPGEHTGGEANCLLACTIAGRKWPGRVPPDRELVRFYFRRGGSRPVRAAERRALQAMAIDEFRQVFESAAEPEWTRVAVWRQASPVYRVGHLERVGNIRRMLADCLPCVAVAGSSYDGVGIPDCIASGRAAAAQVASRA